MYQFLHRRTESLQVGFLGRPLMDGSGRVGDLTKAIETGASLELMGQLPDRLQILPLQGGGDGHGPARQCFDKSADKPGVELQVCEPDAVGPNDNVLVNCIWTPPYLLAAQIRTRTDGTHMLIAADAKRAGTYERFGRVIVLPASYGALRAACEPMSREVPPKSRHVAIPARPAAHAGSLSLFA